ncbi:hypothetical protein [Parendozoicomonas sp. Alg238-R29]|uniref:hypothetical protein n=1 Tax=Parendozoicomonas sp. Alg238-R29 TaxID=2993446 RepID=UPI00248F2491|nr:hypothetical protein [Parendozoicomonas sp. Alg238-R29]
MSPTQYLIAWTVYLAAAVGCLAVWVKITSGLNDKLASWLRLWGAVIVLVPGFTNQDMTWFSPAFLAMTYDALTVGPEAMVHNGIIVGGSLVFASLIKLLFFRHSGKSASSEKKVASSHKKSDHKSTREQRSDPKIPAAKRRSS